MNMVLEILSPLFIVSRQCCFIFESETLPTPLESPWSAVTTSTDYIAVDVS
jgi:hypothetical protein